MSGTLFITGNSSGLGRGLTQAFLQSGWHVYGMSRRGCEGLEGDLNDIQCDLGDLDSIVPALDQLTQTTRHFDLVILNAGLLGPIQDLSQTPIETIETLMRVNVWSNKVILDWLLQSKTSVDQIVLISSGAAVNGNRGWGGYSLSKSTLNMLTNLYAPEFPNTHLCALAPGLVDTKMQDYLCDPEKVDDDIYTSVKKLRSARHTEAMPQPLDAAWQIINVLPQLRSLPSGKFADIRTL